MGVRRRLVMEASGPVPVDRRRFRSVRAEEGGASRSRTDGSAGDKLPQTTLVVELEAAHAGVAAWWMLAGARRVVAPWLTRSGCGRRDMGVIGLSHVLSYVRRLGWAVRSWRAGMLAWRAEGERPRRPLVVVVVEVGVGARSAEVAAWWMSSGHGAIRVAIRMSHVTPACPRTQVAMAWHCRRGVGECCPLETRTIGRSGCSDESRDSTDQMAPV